MQVALVAGTAENPILPLMAQTVAVAVTRASKAQAENLTAGVQDLYQELRAAKTGEAVRDALMSRVSRELGLATAVDAALVAGRLVPTAAGFIEAYEPQRASLAESAAFEMSRALKQEVTKANRAYVALAAALKGGLPSALPDVASFKERTGGLALLLGTAKPDVEQAVSFAKTLMTNTSSEVKALQALVLTGPGEAGSAALKVDSLMPSLTPSADGFRAGVAALHGVLNLVGASGPANEVKKAAMYAESAVQVYQAVSLIASAASGWGMVTAASGLLSGGGGLAAFSGAFGGPSADQAAEKAAEARHAETMAAIKQVHTLVEREFSKLNTKVEFIIKQLGEMLQEMERIGRQTDRLVVLVQETNRKVDELTFRVSLNELVRERNINKNEHERCASFARNNQAQGRALLACRTLYSGAAEQLAAAPWMLTFNGLDSAREVLHTVLRFNPDDGRFPDVSWAGARALRYCLDAHGVRGLEQPAFEPSLVLALDGYSNLRRQNRTGFDKTNEEETRQQIQRIRTAASRHRSFVAALRGTTSVKARIVAGQELLLGEGYALMESLFKLYEVELVKFEAAVAELTKKAISQFVDNYPAGPLPKSFDVHLTSSAEPGVSIPFLSAADFGPGKVSGLLQCPACGPDEPNRSLELVIVSMTLSKPLEQLRAEGKKEERKQALEGARSVAPENTGAAKGKILVPPQTSFDLRGHTCEIAVRLYGTEVHRFGYEFTVNEGPTTDTAARSAALGPSQSVQSPIAYLRAQHLKSPWPYEGFVVKRVWPSLQTALVAQATLPAKARDIHVKHIEANYSAKTQELLRAALKTTSLLGGAVATSIEAPLATMEHLGDVMRGVCLLGHEEATSASDVLGRLFDGGVSQRLVDRQLVKDWALEPQKVAGKPDEFEVLGKVARSRFEQLKVAVAFVMDSTNRRGPTYSFERAWRAFAEEFPIAAFPPV